MTPSTAPSTAPDDNTGTAVHDDGLAGFLDVRPQLFGIAYRMLGSVADAEDVVQDAWIRWQNADRRGVQNPAAFLTTTTTRLAINAATSARARRESYVGQWLPEPVDTAADPLLGAERDEALELAVLLLLEKLNPVERAAYVLHEAFGYPYRRIAEILETSEPNARQLARRARLRLTSERTATAPAPVQRRLLEAFVAAARGGRVDELEQLFAEDAVSYSDGGGKVYASRRDIVGRDRVVNFLDNVIRKYWSRSTFEIADVNGGEALVVRDPADEPIALLSTDGSDAGIEKLLVILNPDKLERFRR
ncbi:RNA polymerase sigma-70 factor [Luteimicrobium sp. NPDC057192]|uniref:RNA polymerase sigma-70 factor n=1 Tax=Luteimicrobium sp. NPDC057192 TaxID=3346042 RepID=UPI00363F8474